MLVKNLQRKHKMTVRPLKKILKMFIELIGIEGIDFDLTLVGDSKIQVLNKRFRNKDKPTDVLSFPLYEKDQARRGQVFLGDIVISVPTALRQAEEQKKTLFEELVFLSLHGFLHLLGYDHEKSLKEARQMQKLEREMLEKLRAEILAVLELAPT